MAYVNLQKAFDSVHWKALWDPQQLCGIPPRTVGVLTSRYFAAESALNCGEDVSSSFSVDMGVRQGCSLAPPLFNTCMEWV